MDAIKNGSAAILGLGTENCEVTNSLTGEYHDLTVSNGST